MAKEIKIPDITDVLDDIKPIGTLKKILEILLGKNGCPWDQKQTPKSIMAYLVEESYELAEAIDSGTPEDVCEELGDVLFQVLFIAQLYCNMGHFSLNEVASKIAEKMVKRHPHVFGDQSITDADEVKKQWQTIKTEERRKTPGYQSVLDSVPIKMPALMRAYRISERAAHIGFDWDEIKGVMDKTEEEWREFHSALEKDDPQKVSMEFGDILFTLTNVARFAKIHPESALKDATDKFVKRFQFMEKKVSQEGRKLETIPREEIETLWNQAKKIF